MAWNPIEHLMLAAIAFPLFVRCLLRRAGTYELTPRDLAMVEVFEPVADQTDFLVPPPDSRGSVDTWCTRMLGPALSGAA
jgi:hypothetical protein